MKKLLLALSILLFFAACQKVERPVPKTDWSLYRKAYTFLTIHKDSAFFYFNQVAVSSRDSLQAAMAYNIMAVIQSDAGDHFGAQESLTNSLKFLKDTVKKQFSTLANDYNELGMNSSDLGNYQAAIGFFDRALGVTADSSFIPVILNNKAFAYQCNKDYWKALALYGRLLAGFKEKKGADYTRTLTNEATVKWLINPHYPAAGDLLRALAIRISENDHWGQNSSYINLARYYLPAKPDSSLFYSRKMYNVARELSSPDDELEALGMLVKVAPAATTRFYFARFQRLNDSLQAARNAAKNQFALIRYNVEKNKADNLRLQKDNAEKAYRIIRQDYRFFFLLGTFVVLLTVGLFWYRERKRKLQQAAEKAVAETTRKASKKVHDTVANDIYRIMKQIEYDAVPGKEQLLDEIDDVYQRARDISYELIEAPPGDFQQQLSDLLISFSTDKIRVVLTGNDDKLWGKVNPAYRLEIKYILQELMVNMVKHSNAENVIVKFGQVSGRCFITYTDDGIGLKQNCIFGNGLTNTGNRIKAILGEISFEHAAGKGVNIRITFPIN